MVVAAHPEAGDRRAFLGPRGGLLLQRQLPGYRGRLPGDRAAPPGISIEHVLPVSSTATGSRSRSPSAACRSSGGVAAAGRALGHLRPPGGGRRRVDPAWIRPRPAGRPDRARGRRRAEELPVHDVGYDAPVIRADANRRRAELGNFNQRLMRRGVLPAAAQAAAARRGLVHQLEGQACADNPLGIADELRRRGDDREHIWAVADWSAPAPNGATVVLNGTEEYYDGACPLPVRDRQRRHAHSTASGTGQLYVQTWHGTPLKRIGFDIEPAAVRQRHGLLRPSWPRRRPVGPLLSPNPFSTPDHAAGVQVRRRDLRVRLPAQRRAVAAASPAPSRRTCGAGSACRTASGW